MDQFRHIAARGVPGDPSAQVALLQQIEAISSDYAPGILAVEGVADDPTGCQVHLLTRDEIQATCGTDRPTLSEVRANLGQLGDRISRGMAFGLPIFEDDRPVSWFFAGWSTD